VGCGVVQLPPVLLPGWAGGQPWLHRVRCVSPFTALFAVTQNAFRGMGPRADTEAVERFFLFMVGACVVLFGLAWLGAGRFVLRPPRGRKRAITRETALWLRLVRRLLFVIDPRRRRFRIPLLVNPMFVLEFRTRAASVTNMLRALFGSLILSIALVLLLSLSIGPRTMDVVRLVAVSIQFGLIILLAPSLTAGTVSTEVEHNTLDLLRTTPVRPLGMLLGKLFAALGYGVMLLLAVTPVFLALMYIQEKFEPQVLIRLVSVAGATILLAICSGICFSSLCRRTATSAALTYGLTGLIVVATALAPVLGDRLHPALARAVVSLNPVIAAVAIISGRLFQAYYDVWQTNVLILCSLAGLALLGAAWRLHVLVEPTK